MFNQTSGLRFSGRYWDARHSSEQIREATSEFDYGLEARYFLWTDGPDCAGYAVRSDGELVYVFSTVRGMGDRIVSSAVENGAVYLDCFDGYLPDLYSRHGFIAVKRVANWTVGAPDVIYMALRGYFSRHGLTEQEV